MHDIELTGLRADLPIGAMAAFGCLRVVQRSEEFRGARLGWQSAGGSFSAVLRTRSQVTNEDLIGVLLNDAKQGVSRPELTWRSKLKGLEVKEFREAANLDMVDWLAAFGSEVVLDRDGKIEPTPLDMTGGPQEFIAGARELGVKLSSAPAKRNGKTPEESFREALFGPWRYEDDQHSLGWDPSTIKLGAFTYRAPTKMANNGVMAAIWLAFQSIPLFPCFGVRDNLEARAFTRERRGYKFTWPVWREPITLDELGFLLSLKASDEKDFSALAARGVVALYRSPRFYLNKYYASFRPPELIFGGAITAAR